MTFKDFKIYVRKDTIFDRYWNYGLCITLISFFSFSTIYITLKPESFQDLRLFLYSIFLFFIVLGTYGVIRLLPKRYEIITIDSGLPLAKKQNVLRNLMTVYEVSSIQNEGGYYSFTIRPSFWNNAYKVYLYYDDTRVAFSLQSQGSSTGGFIDFGGTEEKRRELASTLMELMIEQLRAANISLQQ